MRCGAARQVNGHAQLHVAVERRARATVQGGQDRIKGSKRAASALGSVNTLRSSPG